MWRGGQDWAARYRAGEWRDVPGLGFRLSGEFKRPRKAARTGRPFGTPGFAARLGARLDRARLPQKRGLKPRAEDQPRTAAARGSDV